MDPYGLCNDRGLGASAALAAEQQEATRAPAPWWGLPFALSPKDITQSAKDIPKP